MQKEDDTMDKELATSSCSNDQQEHISINVPETHVLGQTDSQHSDDHNIQEHLERQIEKRASSHIIDQKENDTSLCHDQSWTECSQALSDESLQFCDVRNNRGPRTECKFIIQPKQMSMCQQFLYIRYYEDQIPQKYSQLFWGLPSLHSESLVATVQISSRNSPQNVHFIFFNGICKASMVQMSNQKSIPIPYCHSLPLSELQSQSFAQPKYQAQHFHFSQPQDQHQSHLQSELPNLPSSSSPSQIRDCGVAFHRCQDQPDTHITSANKYLEKKQQESLWGVPVLNKSQGIIYPQIPSIPLTNQSSYTYVPVSLLKDHFHLTSESQQNLNHHLSRKLVPRWCLHAYPNLESQGLMEPQYTVTEASQQHAGHDHSQCSELQGQNHKDLTNIEWHLLGSFHERIPKHSQLKKDGMSNLCNILGKVSEDSPQRISKCYLEEGLKTASDISSNCFYYTRNDSGSELFRVFRTDIGHSQVKSILRLHLSRKFWQITMGRIPICVCRSWLGDDDTSPSYGYSQVNVGNTELGEKMRGKAYCQITIPQPFIDFNTQQKLESHIIRFRANQILGLPLKVAESIKYYMSRETKTWPLPQLEVQTSPSHVLRPISKTEVSRPFEKTPHTSQGNQEKTNSVSNLDCPLPAPSVNHKIWETLKNSPSYIKKKFSVDFQRIKTGGQIILPDTHSSIDNVSQRKMDNTCKVKLPTVQNGTDHEEKTRNGSFQANVEMNQGQSTMKNNLEPFLMTSVSREIQKSDELCLSQSQSDDVLVSKESLSSEMINVKVNKEESTLSTEFLTPKAAISENTNIKNQTVNGHKFKSKNRQYKEVQRPPSDVSVTSGYLSSKSSLTHVQSISCGDIEAPHVLQIQLEDSEIRTEQQQETCASEYDPLQCHNNFPPDAMKLDIQSGQYVPECSGVQTCTIQKTCQPAEDLILKDISPSLSQNEQYHASYLGKKMRQYIPWLNKRQNSQQKAQETTKSCNHEALSVRESCLRYVRQVLDRNRVPSNVMAFEDQPCPSKFSLLTSRRTMQTPNPSCAHQVSQVALNRDESSVFSDMVLLFKQKTLLQHFKEGIVSP